MEDNIKIDLIFPGQNTVMAQIMKHCSLFLCIIASCYVNSHQFQNIHSFYECCFNMCSGNCSNNFAGSEQTYGGGNIL
jgi:hypothetical protein